MTTRRIDDKPGSCEGCYHLGTYSIDDDLGYYCKLDYSEYTTTNGNYVLEYSIIPDPLHCPHWCRRWADSP